MLIQFTPSQVWGENCVVRVGEKHEDIHRQIEIDIEPLFGSYTGPPLFNEKALATLKMQTGVDVDVERAAEHIERDVRLRQIMRGSSLVCGSGDVGRIVP